ncbi:MAG: glycosyltransferase family 2 protein [bacterium]|nr:glycosyltransferase family 2 protein [bacterium]
MKDHFITSSFGQWLLESLIPICSWILISMPFWLSPFHPAIVAYFIILFDLYFLYKSLSTAYYTVISYKEILLHSQVPYVKKIQKMKESSNIKHFIIIPNYKEPTYKIAATIESIIQNDYPYKNIYLVLAFEKREIEAEEKAKIFTQKYAKSFTEILISYHEIIENEAPGKASNQTFAAYQVEKYIEEHKLVEQQTLITICDADSHLPTNYFSYLTYEFLRDTGRLYHFYWAPVLLYNNFWQLPLFVRMQATLSSILRLALLSYKENLIQISTYSCNFWMLKKLGYWDTDIIPEDWHIYFQAFFTFGSKVKTIPLFTIINGDAVYSGGLIKTLMNRYEQEKRWAWGVSDIGYALKKFFTTPHIPIFAKLKKIIFVAENHLLWPTSFFILTLSASIPPLINPIFKRTVLGFLLPQLSGLILTFSSLMLVLYIYIDIKLRKKIKIHTTVFALPLLIIQWYLLPFVSFIFSSLPALDAHTRILLGKKIQYKVTEKV